MGLARCCVGANEQPAWSKYCKKATFCLLHLTYGEFEITISKCDGVLCRWCCGRIYQGTYCVHHHTCLIYMFFLSSGGVLWGTWKGLNVEKGLERGLNVGRSLEGDFGRSLEGDWAWRRDWKRLSMKGGMERAGRGKELGKGLNVKGWLWKGLSVERDLEGDFERNWKGIERGKWLGRGLKVKKWLGRDWTWKRTWKRLNVEKELEGDFEKSLERDWMWKRTWKMIKREKIAWKRTERGGELGRD